MVEPTRPVWLQNTSSTGLNLSPNKIGDRWLIAAFEGTGYSGQEPVWLNSICNHQQVMLESDIFGTDGIYVDKRYLKYREHNAHWSRWKFSKQKPTLQHFNFRCRP
jgi:hypothetical protein